MGRPGANASASVSILAMLLLAGCTPPFTASEVQDKDRDSEDSPARGGGEEPADPSQDESPAEEPEDDSRNVSNEHDWNGGATETTTDSGVTFAVPADWERYSPTQDAGGDEAIYLWEDEDGVFRYAESAVFNTGEPGDPEDGISAYIDVVASMGDPPEDDDRGEPEDLDVPGTDDALRVDYTLPQPGFADVAEGSVIGFTAATGDLILFTVSIDGDNATSELNEEIISTVAVGAPPDSGV